MFEFFDSPLGIVLFTAFGATMLWFKENAAVAKSGQMIAGSLRVFVMADLIDRFHLTENKRYSVLFALFVFLGTMVALGIAKPTNAVQGLSAGLGWTAALSYHQRQPSP